MILPFAIVYFGVGWFVLRNQALNVYVPSYESNGRMWPHMHTRILAALFLFQITMIGYFSVKNFLYSPLLIPLPFVTLAFLYVCKKCFYTSFCITSLEVASNDVKEVPSLFAVVEAFTPPCVFVEDMFDDVEQYDDAQSTISSRTTSMATSNVWPTISNSWKLRDYCCFPHCCKNIVSPYKHSQIPKRIIGQAFCCNVV